MASRVTLLRDRPEDHRLLGVDGLDEEHPVLDHGRAIRHLDINPERHRAPYHFFSSVIFYGLAF